MLIRTTPNATSIHTMNSYGMTIYVNHQSLPKASICKEDLIVGECLPAIGRVDRIQSDEGRSQIRLALRERSVVGGSRYVLLPGP